MSSEPLSDENSPVEPHSDLQGPLETAQPPIPIPLGPPVADGAIQPLVRPSWLHPTSVFFHALSHGRKMLLPAIIAVFGAARGDVFWLVFSCIIFVLVLLATIIRYVTLRYRIQDGDLVVTEGLLFRRVRTVPAKRIQSIELLQNVLHRIFGVAEVRVETASGTEPEAILRVLALDQVEKLRHEIRALRTPKDSVDVPSADTETTGEVQSQPAERVLLEIPTAWLVRTGLASNRGMLIIGIIVGALFQFDIEERIDPDRLLDIVPEGLSTLFIVIASVLSFLLLLVLLRLLGIIWYLLRFHGYRLSRCGNELRIACGLLTKVSAVVPLRRIQFISVHRPWILRWMGYASIRIETAGGSGTDKEDPASTVSRRWFAPVLPEHRVSELLGELRDGLDWDESAVDWKPLAPKAGKRMLRLAVIQSLLFAAVGLAAWRPWGWTAGLVVLPILVAWAVRRSRSVRYARTDFGVSYRSGVLNRKLSLTFFEKIQTLSIDQSPFDRRWKMATLSIDTAAAGPAEHKIVIPYLDEAFAREEFDHLRADAASRQRI